LLKSKNIPGRFWGEAVSTVVHILNRAPTRSLQGLTLYEAWHNKKTKVDYLHTFGCVAHVKKIEPEITKLIDRSTKTVFIGYEKGTKGYRLYDPVAKKLHISRDVIFEENKAWDWDAQTHVDPVTSVFEVERFFVVGQNAEAPFEVDVAAEVGGIVEPATPVQGYPPQGEASHNMGPNASPSQAAPPGVLLAQGIEFVTPPTSESVDSDGVGLRFRTVQNIIDSTDEVQGFEYSGLCYFAAEEPRSVEEALSKQCWKNAMLTEMNTIQSNKTWELSSLSTCHRAIGLKWVFKVKKDPQRRIIKHKARLVAKRYA
jgi:hypothetical protein